MHRLHRLSALWLAALLFSCLAPLRAQALNACAEGGRLRADEGGITGSGVRPVAPGDDDSGIGGTGARPRAPEDDDSGIGGTGISAGDTGVIGTITGFASICVGGLEVHYESETPVHIDGQAAVATDLAVGQVVEVVAGVSGSELTAREIAVHHVVSGPVTNVDEERGEITVIGQRVQLLASTRVADEEAATVEAFPAGTFVQVSGMRRADGVIVASRVTRADTPGLVRLTGPWVESAAGGVSVAGTRVEIDAATRPAGDDEVRVVGQWTGEAVRAQSVESLPRVPFDGRVARFEIEGFARQSAGGQLRVGSFPVELPSSAAGLRQPLASGERVRIEGYVRDRRVLVEGCEVMNDLPQRPARPENDNRGPRDGAFQDHGAGVGEHGPGNDPPHPFDQPRPEPIEGGAAHDGADKPSRPEARGVGAPPRGDRPAQPPERADRPDRPDRPRPPEMVRPERPDVPRPIRPDLPHPERPEGPPERPPPRPELPPRIERPPLPPRG